MLFFQIFQPLNRDTLGKMAAAIDTQFIVKQFGTGLRQVLGSTDTLTTEDAFNHLKVVHGKSDGKHAGVDGETRKVLMDQGFRDCLTNGYLAGESDTALDLTKCRTGSLKRCSLYL